jgi:2',3'-cyclic-nucleotide 2'-phosphodiesterase (5'-nucleotidase family)
MRPRTTILAKTLVTTLALGTATAPHAAPGSPGPTFTLLFTGAVRGWVEPCGCTTEPLGGVFRLKGEVDKSRAKGPTLFLDAGGLLHDKDAPPDAERCRDEARVKLLLSSLRACGAQATGLGPLDLSRGDGARAQALQEAGLPAVSSNVVGAAGVKTRLVVEVAGVKVGVVGVTWPEDVAGGSPSPMGTSWKGITLLPPTAPLAREVKAARGEGARLVVLLAQASRAEVVRLVDAVEGIDLVLLGYDPGETPRGPESLKPGTWLLAAGNQGQFLGRVGVTLAGDAVALAYDDQGKTARDNVARLEERMAQLADQVRQFMAQGPAGEANAAARQAKVEELAQQVAALKSSATAAAGPTGSRFTWDVTRLGVSSAVDKGLQGQFKAYKASLPKVDRACQAGGR